MLHISMGTNDFDLNRKPPGNKMLHKQEHLRFPTDIDLPQENIRRFELSIEQTRHVFQQLDLKYEQHFHRTPVHSQSIRWNVERAETNLSVTAHALCCLFTSKGLLNLNKQGQWMLGQPPLSSLPHPSHTLKIPKANSVCRVCYVQWGQMLE